LCSAIERRIVTEKVEDKKFLDDFLAYLLARASHLVSEDYSVVLKNAGIDRQHWRILASLRDCDKITIGELAKIVLMKQPTLTKILDRMEEEKLVKRQHSKEDRRSIKIAITKNGKEKVSALLIKAKEHEKIVLKDYSDEEEIILKRVLRTLIERM
jgi:MarR family transcriptional regulator, organic hydroperoxide resistance regulator|tara:strand:- start:15910 stop:16377 length:468 start_codon:yes stop_codon:yes gene_type:complete